MNDLPDEFTDRLKQIIPDNHWDKVCASFQCHKPLVLRINTLRTDIGSILAAFEQANIPCEQPAWKRDTLIVKAQYRSQVLDSELYQKGLLYSQNLSSQLAPLALDPQSGDEVLDMCAAPGGKTSQLACMMRDNGRIAAVEKAKARFFKMKANFKTLQHHSIHTYLADAVVLWRKTPERFDRVLLDAPCSSEARFQTFNPDSYAHWTLRKIRETSRKQKKLIYSAVNCLKPGGVLVYCTCSFAPEENEAIIDHIVNTFPQQLSVVPVDIPVSNTQPGLTQWQGNHYHESLRKSVRVLPDEIMDGFYICKLLKNVSTLRTR
ncbi:MAG: RsmB/NOP family class I SAM-dependent RNA methyltransferase [Gammaproteobacteria bacterium]|nr:RsmB/NOP family class I SAM-dependent RNA methyltransferase [Gammaproteobacteria bacterium]